jgi:hypothetical protein
MCVVARQPWMGPCETWWAPRCRSRPLSRRHTPRRGEAAPPAHLLRCGPCSCAGLHHAAVPGTSKCLHGAARNDIHTPHQEQRRTLKEL